MTDGRYQYCPNPSEASEGLQLRRDDARNSGIDQHEVLHLQDHCQEPDRERSTVCSDKGDHRRVADDADERLCRRESKPGIRVMGNADLQRWPRDYRLRRDPIRWSCR